MEKKNKLFMVKGGFGEDLTFDLSKISHIILPSYMSMKPEQKNANIAVVAIAGVGNIGMTYTQVEKVRRAWYAYHDYDQAMDEPAANLIVQ